MSRLICVVTETFRPEINGVAMTIGHLVDGLRERGYRVQVVRPRQSVDGTLPQSADGANDWPDITVAGLPLPGYPHLRFGLPAGRLLRRLWRTRRPDLVHVVTEGPLGWSAVQSARKLGIPVTSGFHTNFDSYTVFYGFGWLRALMAAYLRILHRRTQVTLVPTAALAASLAGEGIQGVKVVGRGVDTQLYNPGRRCAALRQSWGVPEQGLACIYVGRLAAEKNPGLVVKTFAALAAVHGDVRMIWVGDGPLGDRLRRDHPDHHFAGMRVGEDLAAHYASADLFLFPSLTETYGNVVSEAMACGLPVLAYRSAAAAELIEHGVRGFTVNPGDEAEFVNTALLALQDRAALPAQGKAASEHLATRGWAAVVQRFAGIVEDSCRHAHSLPKEAVS